MNDSGNALSKLALMVRTDPTECMTGRFFFLRCGARGFFDLGLVMVLPSVRRPGSTLAKVSSAAIVLRACESYRIDRRPCVSRFYSS
jgi:hypothetical protein